MRAVQESGFGIVRIKPRHLALLEELVPSPGHKDPFGHMVLVHAMAEEAILVTSDRELRSYGVRCL
ncbi:MAG TPA: hypothetical protein VHG29_00270 [Novosphingobium sp.]|nr:hypothetical protein [Novosphingobium sp.]